MNENPFFALVNFAQCDQKILSFQAQRSNLQTAILKLEHEIAQLQKTAHAEKITYIAVRKKVDEIELEIRTLRDREKKAHINLENASSVKEYHSLEKEIASFAAERTRLEDTLFEAWQNAEMLEEKSRITHEQLTETTAQKKTAIEINKQEIAALEIEEKQLQKESARLWLLVPEEWQEKYTTMKRSVPNPVVSVVNGACSSCFYSLLPQELHAVRLHKLLPCQDCYRLLYSVQP